MLSTKISEMKEIFPKIDATPTVAVSRGGRIFASFIGDDGDCAVILSSRNENGPFEVCAEIIGDGEDKVESCRLWNDPLGRMWVIWSFLPSAKVYCSICAEPDADVLEWSEEKNLDFGTLLARPLVTSSGAWMFMSAVSANEIVRIKGGEKKKGMYVYRSEDEGNTFEQVGKVFANTGGFDAATLIEKGGKFVAYIRTNYGVGKFISADGAESFKAETDSGYCSNGARFALGIMPSAHTLMINNGNFAPDGSRCLAAMLSLTDGMVYHGIMCLEDGGVNTSNPEFCTYGDTIYSIHVRAAEGKNELVLSRFTETDVLEGKPVSDASKLGMVIA